MGNNSIDPMLTTSEVAHSLNVHINTVRRWRIQKYRNKEIWLKTGVGFKSGKIKKKMDETSIREM